MAKGDSAKAERAVRMIELAQELCNREGKRAQAEASFRHLTWFRYLRRHVPCRF